MQLLHGVTRNYTWGSRTLIPELMGEEPSDAPVAEVWFGAHPGGPSVVDGEPLNEVIARDPRAALGEKVIARQAHERLPFLVKLLAAAAPLSLQAHPTMEQAEEGYARENEAGIPVDDKERNYKDPSHKPEIIIALTDFYAMAGFRPVEKTRQLLDALHCPELDRYLGLLEGYDDSQDEAGDLRALFTTWITIPFGTRKPLVDAVVAAAQRVIDAAEHSLPDGVEQWMVNDLGTIVGLNERYPGDVGVLGALLLNHIHLQPGEAIFLAAGQLHAYVRGLGVEVMANSDNVLRGGLTPKYVDVPELVKVLSFTPAADPRVEPQRSSEQDSALALNYPVPVPEFSVTRVQLDQDSGDERFGVAAENPAIVLCVSGTAQLSNESTKLSLRAGQAAWLPADDPAATITAHEGAGTEVFVVRA